MFGDQKRQQTENNTRAKWYGMMEEYSKNNTESIQASNNFFAFLRVFAVRQTRPMSI